GGVGVLQGGDAPAPAAGRRLEERAGALWDLRDLLLERLGMEGANEVRGDLLDLAVLWTDLRVRLAGPGQVHAARRTALEVLAEAEARFGPSRVLYPERQP